MDPKKLAVYKHRRTLISKLRKNQVIVIEAPTGSGKTTQIPQIVYHSRLFNKDRNLRIGVTQPRRIAAISVCERIAFEMGEKLREKVGYKIRFDDNTINSTRIKIMTDGILLEELRSDPYLEQYQVLMVDEAHERSLNIDFILGLLKKILKQRPEFKIIISSATINASIFSQYFDDCPIVSIKARSFPIKCIYKDAEAEDADLCNDEIVKIVKNILHKTKKGDILIFLPGESSIKKCINQIQLLNTDNLEILPLYSRLSNEEQKRVFNVYKNKRKIVVATNIAETSITIDGIVYVIDSGLCKLNYFNPRTYTSFLELKKISIASADQRKGRSGRTQKGYCFRLYSLEDYESRDQFTKEEIFRTDLSEVILRMADLGIYEYHKFDFISQPSHRAIDSAINTLKQLGALDSRESITKLGKRMVQFPLTPRISCMLIECIDKYPAVIDEVLILASFLSTRSPFLFPQDEEYEARQKHRALYHYLGDFVTWINLFRKYQTIKNRQKFCEKNYLDQRIMDELINIHNQLTDMVQTRGIRIETGGSYKDFILSVGKGFSHYICIKNKKGHSFNSLTEKNIYIHPGSALFHKNVDCLISGEIVNTGRTYCRSASSIEKDWIKQISMQVHSGLFEKKKKIKADQKHDGKKNPRHTIKVGWEEFEIIEKKNSKQVVLPWKKLYPLASIKDEILYRNFKNLKGCIFYKNYTLLEGKTLNKIFTVFDLIDLQHGILHKYPRGKYAVQKNADLITFHLKNVLKPALINRKKKQLGFLSFKTNFHGIFWLSVLLDYYDALEESVESLEYLLSFEKSDLDKKNVHKIKKIYNKIISHIKND